MTACTDNRYPHLIIVRGNSGSGKSTVSKALRDALREEYGKGSTMYVSQDAVRVDMLDVKDTSDTESIALIRDICLCGLNLKKNIILDGILDRWKYGDMLALLSREWGRNVHVYYFDIPLEVTLARHATRPQKSIISEADLREWYNTDNRLKLLSEHIFDETVSVEEAVAKILADCRASSL